MKDKNLEFLKELVETASPTGNEESVAGLVRNRLSSVADEIQTDTMGSVHAILKGTTEISDELYQSNLMDQAYSTFNDSLNEEDYEYASSYGSTYGLDNPDESYIEDQVQLPVTNFLTLMLAAHMDEVGLMVTYISDDGFLSVSSLGGVDAAILPGMRVDVHTASGKLRGVVGRKPIHLIDADDRKTVTPLDKLVIDLGLPPNKVRKKVRIGDPITYGVGYENFGKNMAVSKSFDDKCGVYVACRVMEELASSERPRATFISAITVQEEIGTRGAITSSHSINPDVAIAFDVTHATDYPGIEQSKYGKIVCGKGPVIARGPNINPLVFERLVAAAEAEGIDYQIEAEPSVTGTDARSIQVSQGGIPTGLISIPLRYMHTPTEVIDLADLEDAIRLIVRFARDLTDDSTFIPGISEEIEHPQANEVNQEPDTQEETIRYLKKELKALKKKLAKNENMAERQPYNMQSNATAYMQNPTYRTTVMNANVQGNMQQGSNTVYPQYANYMQTGQTNVPYQYYGQATQTNPIAQSNAQQQNAIQQNPTQDQNPAQQNPTQQNITYNAPLAYKVDSQSTNTPTYEGEQETNVAIDQADSFTYQVNPLDNGQEQDIFDIIDEAIDDHTEFEGIKNELPHLDVLTVEDIQEDQTPDE